jgi:hypothetical protein
LGNWNEETLDLQFTQLPNYSILPSPRPKFARVAEEMKQWSALLGAELASWPAVTSRRMFGMTVFYRKGVVFAALPRTRSFETPRSVAFKLYKKSPRVRKLLEADSRIANPLQEDAKWIRLELESEKDLADALKWFDLAYRTCPSKSNSKS